MRQGEKEGRLLPHPSRFYGWMREGLKMSYTHKKGKGAGTYNGMQKATDWDGKRIKAVRQVRNDGGYGATPGMLGTVDGVYAGLNITFDVCTHCGTVTHINKVGYFDVELAEQ